MYDMVLLVRLKAHLSAALQKKYHKMRIHLCMGGLLKSLLV